MPDEFEVTLERIEQFRFDVQFGDREHSTLTMDEPAPLGTDMGPNAARVLAAAIGNCLSASRWGSPTQSAQFLLE